MLGKKNMKCPRRKKPIPYETLKARKGKCPFLRLSNRWIVKDLQVLKISKFENFCDFLCAPKEGSGRGV